MTSAPCLSNEPLAARACPIGGLAVSLLAHSETGLMALDAQDRVSFANRAALELLGIGSYDEGEPMLRLVERAGALALTSAETLANWLGSTSQSTTGLMLDNGRSVSLERAPAPERHTVLSLKLEPRAQVPPSRRDTLTGLADRTWFFDRLTQCLADPVERPVILLLDLDYFKAINDSFGHQVGDTVLQVVGKRLTSSLRDADVICRLSGDEFAVLLPHTSDVRLVAQRLLTALTRPCRVEGVTVAIGASIGIAQSPDHGNDPAALVRAATVALESVKATRRGELRLYDADLAGAVRKRRSMIDGLRRAVPSRQLEMHYQPIASLSTGSVIGFEALARWRHPQFGLMAPDEFIPLAEESNLIWTISEWALRTAGDDAGNWPLHLVLGLNLSVKQLLDRGRLSRLVKSALLRTALAPNRLEIEVPEAVFEREAETLPVLTSLRQLGVRIGIDRFGAGNTTLGQLRRFPIDRIKIHSSFVQALGADDEAQSAIRSIAGLARSLGITTTAVQVETREQRDLARREGCTDFQGFLLGEPMTADQVHATLLAGEPIAVAG